MIGFEVDITSTEFAERSVCKSKWCERQTWKLEKGSAVSGLETGRL